MQEQTVATGKRSRLEHIDVVRGLAMVIMALDHVREFVSDAPFDPTDMAHTSPAYFFTRWITHFCAPVFVLLAGTSIFLASARSTTVNTASMLVKRGLWLILLELVFVTPLGWAFNVHYGFTRLQVIWATGGAMVLMAPTIRLLKPMAILGLGLTIVTLHDALSAHESMFGPLATTWKILGDFKIFKPFPGHIVASIYPIAPWFGIMATGYGLGRLFQLPAMQQRRALLSIGVLASTAFVMLRWSQVYGDPKPWAHQATAIFTVLSFLNCTKYPPSLLYTLMTLGPAFIMLSFADRLPGAFLRPLSLLGRVPLFFYLLHLPLLHAMSVVAVWLAGNPVAWLFVDSITIGHTPTSATAAYGLSLAAVYGIWALGLILLYPLCKAYARVKDSRRHPWLAYL